MHNLSEFQWNIFACYVVDVESSITWTCYNSLTKEGEATQEDFENASLVKGSPALSTIMYYFAKIQESKANKPKQQLMFVPGTTASQGDNSACGYFTAAAARQLFDAPARIEEPLLQDIPHNRIVVDTKRDIVACFKYHLDTFGVVKGQYLSQTLGEGAPEEQSSDGEEAEKTEVENAAKRDTLKKRLQSLSKQEAAKKVTPKRDMEETKLPKEDEETSGDAAPVMRTPKKTPRTSVKQTPKKTPKKRKTPSKEEKMDESGDEAPEDTPPAKKKKSNQQPKKRGRPKKQTEKDDSVDDASPLTQEVPPDQDHYPEELLK